MATEISESDREKIAALSDLLAKKFDELYDPKEYGGASHGPSNEEV